MISLPELRARNVTPIWQESVAVVQELIQTVKATTGSAELLPDLEHVALIPNGDVVALPGSPEPAVPVRHAAVLLRLLVDGVAAPPELEQFIERNVAEPPQYDTVAEFSRNLAFFERPGRRSDVERLVARAVAAEQSSRADEELRRLKERAAEVTHETKPPEFLEQATRKAKTVPIAAVAAVGVVVIATGLWLLQKARSGAADDSAPAAVTAAADQAAADQAAPANPSEPGAAAPAPETPGAAPAAATAPADANATGQGSQPTAPAPTPEAPKSLVARAADAVKSAVGSLVGGSKTAPAAPAAAATTASAPATNATSASRPRRRPAQPKPEAVTASATPAPAPAAPLAPLTPVAMEAAPAYPPSTVDRATEEPVVVFTAADASVTPAVIVRPVLPKEPPPNVPPEQIGTIDVWVDERGDVTRVKLISPANRFHERMLVSAAKMWKFRPAYKDGRPVRYVARVRLTI